MAIEKSRLISKIFFGVFWMLAAIPFFMQELTPDVYEKIISPLQLIADFSLICLGLWVVKKKTDWFFIITFFILAYISTCVYNGLSLTSLINGLRLYLCFMFVIPIFRYFYDDENRRTTFIKKTDKALYLFLWLQLPTATIQCILYGAYDYVGGSLGWMLSGEMSTLVYLVSFYFMHKNWNKEKSYFQNIKENWTLIFLLVPSFLNETKISFVYLLMYFFFLLPMDRKFIKRMLIFIPCMIILFSIAGYFYLSVTGADDNVLTEQYITMYLSGDDDALNYMELAIDQGADELGDDQGDLFRGIKIAALPFLHMKEPHAAMLGFGVSQFKGGKSLDKTEFAKEHEWLLKGTVMTVFMVLVELGYLGLILVSIFWIALFMQKPKECTRNKPLIFYLILSVILLAFYNNAFICTPFYLIFLYISFISNRWNYVQCQTA